MRIKQNTIPLSFDYGWKNNKLNLINRDVPLKQKFVLSLKLGHQVDSLYSKTFVAEITSKSKIVNRKGDFESGWVTTSLKSFGQYTLMVDTLAPKIQQINLILEL